MINYDSILSAFDGKPTLLQWLKMVKKALDESVLKDVTIAKDGDNIAFTFNFEDGTSVTTPKVALPKGDKGDKGDAGTGIVSVTYDHTQIIGDNTETYFKVTLSSGVENTFAVFAKNGVSITGINTVSNEVVGGETLTTLRANYSNNTSDEFVVTAKNGKEYDNYLYCVELSYSGGSSIFFNIYSRKDSLTQDDIINYIPDIDVNSDITDISNKKITAFYNEGNGTFGDVCVAKFNGENGASIKFAGIIYDASSRSIRQINSSFNITNYNYTLLGINL